MQGAPWQKPWGVLLTLFCFFVCFCRTGEPVVRHLAFLNGLRAVRAAHKNCNRVSVKSPGTTATKYTVNVLSSAATLTGVTDTTDASTIVFTVNGDKTITAKDGAANVTNLAGKNIAKGKIAFTTATGATAAPTFAGSNVADGDTVVVTAADGTKATYTFKDVRSNDATLKTAGSITVDNAVEITSATVLLPLTHIM